MVDLEKKFPLFILILLKAYNAVVTSVRITSRNTSKYSITIGLQQGSTLRFAIPIGTILKWYAIPYYTST